MASCKISTEAAVACCNALTALLNGGTIDFYSGTKPAGPDTAISSQTLLGTATFGNPAFASAALVGNNGEAAANAVTGDTTADQTGLCSFFRARKSNGTAVWDDDAGAIGSGAACEMNSPNITAGLSIGVSSVKLRVPRG